MLSVCVLRAPVVLNNQPRSLSRHTGRRPLSHIKVRSRRLPMAIPHSAMAERNLRLPSALWHDCSASNWAQSAPDDALTKLSVVAHLGDAQASGFYHLEYLLQEVSVEYSS